MSSAITTGHLCCTQQMGEIKGFLWEGAERRVRTGLLCYTESKGTPPLCRLGVNSNISIMGCNKLLVVFKISILFFQVSKNAIIFPCFVSSHPFQTQMIPILLQLAAFRFLN